MADFTLTFSKNTIEFVTVGKEYLSFCESKTKGGRDEFALTSLKLLSLLYLKALTLPDIVPRESDEEEDVLVEKFVTEEAWAFVKNRVENRLDDWDDMVELQDASMMNTTEFIHVSLSELYADIYQDVGDLIGAYQMGDENTMYDALYICKENFRNYWGIRALKISQILHPKVYAEEENEV